MPESTPFAGEMWTVDGRAFLGHVEGEYRWLEGDSIRRHIAGGITIRPGRSSPGLGREAHPFHYFGLSGAAAFEGRVVRLVMPGVGDSAVVLTGGRYRAGTSDAVDIAFEAWSPPILSAPAAELGELLRTPVFDALEQSGYPELAAVARAAAVALAGWPARPGDPVACPPRDDPARDHG